MNSRKRVPRAHRLSSILATQSIEPLEERRLLATHSYTVPSGHTAAYLLPRLTPGEVDVRLDTATGTVVHTFTNIDGVDIVSAGSNSGFTFIDRVPAAFKPTADGDGDKGIKVQGGSGGTLRVEAGIDDTLIQVTGSTSSSATIQVTDSSSNVGLSQFGSGVSHLELRTNDVDASAPYPSGGTKVDVGYFAAATSLKIDTGVATYSTINLGDGIEFHTVLGAEIITGAGNSVVNLLGDDDEASTASIDFNAGIGDGEGNTLNISPFCTATLHKASGSASHNIKVDEINVDGDATFEVSAGCLVIADAAIIGEINCINPFDGFEPSETPERATVLITEPASIGVFTSNPGSVTSIEAPSEIGQWFLEGTATFTGTSSGSIVGSFSRFTQGMGGPWNNGVVNLDSSADVTVLNSSVVTTLNIEDALMTLAPRDGDLTEEEGHTLVLNHLSLGASGITGVLDLTDGNLVVAYSGSTPLGTWSGGHYTEITGMLESGFDEGAWDGVGILTSSQSDGHYTIGIGEAADVLGLGSTDTATWQGATVDDTTLLIRFTWSGDVNLDGYVDGEDYFYIDTHVQDEAMILWYANGDLNFDGDVTNEDYFYIDSNIAYAQEIGAIL